MPSASRSGKSRRSAAVESRTRPSWKVFDRMPRWRASHQATVVCSWLPAERTSQPAGEAIATVRDRAASSFQRGSNDCRWISIRRPSLRPKSCSVRSRLSANFRAAAGQGLPFLPSPLGRGAGGEGLFLCRRWRQRGEQFAEPRLSLAGRPWPHEGVFVHRLADGVVQCVNLPAGDRGIVSCAGLILPGTASAFARPGLVRPKAPPFSRPLPQRCAGD